MPTLTDLPMLARQHANFVRRALLLAPLLLVLGGASGSLAGSAADNPWFTTLDKPALYPPALAFPLVWSVLYVMMGIALAVILAARPSPNKGPAVFGFIKQFALNLAWSPVFFALHSLTGALVVILALVVTIIFTIVYFARISRFGAWLMVPYLAWVVFATGLTWQLRKDNPLAHGWHPTAIARPAPAN